MRGPRALSRTPSDRNPQFDSGTPRVGSDLDPSADILCPFPHATQTMTVVIPDGIEPTAIVHNF